MLLMSTTTLPTRPSGPAAESLRPLATPVSPNSTSCTFGVSGTMVMITSARLATSVALVQTVAPASARSAGIWLRLLTKSW